METRQDSTQTLGILLRFFFIFILPYPFFIAVCCFLFAVYVIIYSPFFFVPCFIYPDLFFFFLSLFKLPRSKWRGRRERLMVFFFFFFHVSFVYYCGFS